MHLFWEEKYGSIWRQQIIQNFIIDCHSFLLMKAMMCGFYTIGARNTLGTIFFLVVRNFYDELAAFDLPTIFSTVQRITGIQKLHFTGYNQGGMLAIAAAVASNYIANSLASVTAIGPICYWENITSPVLQRWAYGWTPDEVILTFYLKTTL
eukprot:TRINITY_DN2872_c0_g2_i2.p2 TRINITY_DN2872_c0_g2~~TRINITY_DN2872_c0_g2_i2.p2  ORF type:complete len:152 (+),score=5.33 TRINITY_DN2872_c0_g2_i2:339-794(+)